ncbi:hypothetical protein AA309_19460 [Microvirga vignae]|uniref:Uncharacterized protein n=1 Tax=Microvirga vignae TaxID=1225564 RepID=A0A0H1R8R6_9HYPH|nr:hypothetical protein [Microvirga vignae]KLK91573.1 hypothetical protein AA309_19460 [Microvirga vignae]
MAKAKDKKKSGKSKSTDTQLSKSMKKAAKNTGIMDLISSNLGREILADALIAAAGAAAAALTRTRPAKQAGAAVADAGSQAADMTQTAAGAVASVVTEAARQFLPASITGAESSEPGGKNEGKKVKYVHRSSDHSKRKTSKAKSDIAHKE